MLNFIQRNIAGATNYVSDAISSGKELVNEYSESLFGVTPFDETSRVPDNAADQITSNEAAKTNMQSAAVDAPIQQYEAFKSRELALDRQKRSQEYLDSNNFAVRLENPQNGDVVAFRVSPESLNESRQAIYKQMEPLHMPGAIQTYTHTTPRNWAISGVKLISRNGVEAEDNLATVTLLRSWLMPYFGDSKTTDKDNYKSEMLGAPPPVLLLSAYTSGKLQSSQQGNGGYGTDSKTIGILRNVPVVIQSLQMPFMNDVDYIPTMKSNQPFPAVLSIDISVIESQSPMSYSEFNLIDYKNGTLDGF